MREQLIIGLKEHLSSSKVRQSAEEITDKDTPEMGSRFTDIENAPSLKCHSRIDLSGSNATGKRNGQTMDIEGDNKDHVSHQISNRNDTSAQGEQQDENSTISCSSSSTINKARRQCEVNIHCRPPILTNASQIKKEPGMEEVDLNKSLKDENDCFTISKKYIETINFNCFISSYRNNDSIPDLLDFSE